MKVEFIKYKTHRRVGVELWWWSVQLVFDRQMVKVKEVIKPEGEGDAVKEGQEKYK